MRLNKDKKQLTKQQALMLSTNADQKVVVVSEMSKTKKYGFIQLADSVNVEKLIEGDKNPMFVIREVIHEGMSLNRVNYTREDIQELYRQILQKKPNAYKGHLDEKEKDNKYPEAKTIWIGAGLKEVEGKLTLFAKGYVLPSQKKWREYLKKAVAVGKDIPLSIYCLAIKKWNDLKQQYDLSGITLQSIDWAREHMEGVPSLTGETFLVSETKHNLNDDDMKWSEVTIENLKENRPDIYKDLAKNVTTVSEMAKALDVEEGKVIQVVSEMQTKIAESQNEVETLRQQNKTHIAKSVVSEMVADNAIRQMVTQYVLSSLPKDAENVEFTVKEMMRSPEVVAILNIKGASSVAATPLTDSATNVSSVGNGNSSLIEIR